jgi:uncharacterized protein (TIGR03084 family)
MGVTMDQVLDDLGAETQVLYELVADLGDTAIAAATPAAGWSIRDQLTHLAYFDETATLAAVNPEAFRRAAEALMAGGEDFPDRIAAEHAELPAADVRDWLVRARREFVAVFRGIDPKARLPWYGPEMSALSSATARLMETWAHGQDVADALGRYREPTDRLRHIAHLGVQTTAFSFSLNGKPVPEGPIQVELAAPSGARWTWGPAGAADRVSGTALDFCLVVTQRRHLDDTALRADGPVAREWLSIAQTFAGSPGTGREPRSVPSHRGGRS